MPKPARKGFTLVELLVVISIIAILSVIGITVFSSAQKSARDAKRRADLQALRLALEQYKTANGIYPVTGAEIWYSSESDDSASDNNGNYILNLAPNYIVSLPRDPTGGASTISGCSVWKRAYLYRSDDGTSYALLSHCSMEAQNWSSNDTLIDPVRPTWALKICDGPPGCGY